MNVSHNNLIYFFFGLLEGDGSIQVNHYKKRYLQYRIIIKLKYTLENYFMLSKIRDEIGFMNLHVRNNCVLLVQDDKKKLLKILELIDLHAYTFVSLHSYKKFFFFRYCLTNNVTYSEYFYIKFNPTGMDQWFSMQPNFADFSRQIDAQTILQLPYFNNWLCGFTEAEGCFSIRRKRKNNSKSFSIGQNNGYEILSAIKLHFEIPNKIRNPSGKFYVIETYNKKCLKKVVDFYTGDNNSTIIGLIGNKKLQLRNFCDSVKDAKDKAPLNI